MRDLFKKLLYSFVCYYPLYLLSYFFVRPVDSLPKFFFSQAFIALIMAIMMPFNVNPFALIVKKFKRSRTQ